MILADWVLIQKHWVWFFIDCSFSIFIVFFVFFQVFLFGDDLFVLQVHIEQDLSLIVRQKICVCSSALEDTKSIVQCFLEILRCITILLSSLFLCKVHLWLICLVSAFDEKSIDVLQRNENNISVSHLTKISLASSPDSSSFSLTSFLLKNPTMPVSPRSFL